MKVLFAVSNDKMSETIIKQYEKFIRGGGNSTLT